MEAVRISERSEPSLCRVTHTRPPTTATVTCPFNKPVRGSTCVNNCPARCNTKQSSYCSASSLYWPNIISNKGLWKVTGQEDINVEIRKRKFRWLGHTLRNEDGDIPKAALLWNPRGNRKRGRLRNSWRRSVIKEAGRSWNELRFLAADRQKWKGLIDNLCS